MSHSTPGANVGPAGSRWGAAARAAGAGGGTAVGGGGVAVGGMVAVAVGLGGRRGGAVSRSEPVPAPHRSRHYLLFHDLLDDYSLLHGDGLLDHFLDDHRFPSLNNDGLTNCVRGPRCAGRGALATRPGWRRCLLGRRQLRCVTLFRWSARRRCRLRLHELGFCLLPQADAGQLHGADQDKHHGERAGEPPGQLEQARPEGCPGAVRIAEIVCEDGIGTRRLSRRQRREQLLGGP